MRPHGSGGEIAQFGAEAVEEPVGRVAACHIHSLYSPLHPVHPSHSTPYTRRAFPAAISPATRCASASDQAPSADPGAEHLGERLAEETCSDHMKFGQTMCAAGEEELAEGGELQDLGEDGGGAGPGADEGGAQIGVHMREDPGEMRRVAVVRVAVQQDQVGAEAGRRAGEVGEQDRVVAVDAQAGLAEPRVQLERQAGGDRDPQEMPEQHRIAQFAAHPAPGQPSPRRAAHLSRPGRFGRERQPVP